MKELDFEKKVYIEQDRDKSKPSLGSEGWSYKQQKFQHQTCIPSRYFSPKRSHGREGKIYTSSPATRPKIHHRQAHAVLPNSVGSTNTSLFIFECIYSFIVFDPRVSYPCMQQASPFLNPLSKGGWDKRGAQQIALLSSCTCVSPTAPSTKGIQAWEALPIRLSPPHRLLQSSTTPLAIRVQHESTKIKMVASGHCLLHMHIL